MTSSRTVPTSGEFRLTDMSPKEYAAFCALIKSVIQTDSYVHLHPDVVVMARSIAASLGVSTEPR